MVIYDNSNITSFFLNYIFNTVIYQKYINYLIAIILSLYVNDYNIYTPSHLSGHTIPPVTPYIQERCIQSARDAIENL